MTIITFIYPIFETKMVNADYSIFGREGWELFNHGPLIYNKSLDHVLNGLQWSWYCL